MSRTPTHSGPQGKNLTCLICGKTFYVHKYRINSAKYCSLICAGKARFGLKTGPHSEAWKKAIKLGHKKSLKKKVAGKKISKARKRFWLRVKNKPRVYNALRRNMSEAHRGNPHSRETRNKMSVSQKARFARKGNRLHKPVYRRFRYSGIWFRSSWEMAFAKWLRGKGIRWIYEPDCFPLTNDTYYPDFYLPDHDLYVEVKGYLGKPNFLKRARKFVKQYKKRICILLGNHLKELGVL